MKLRDKEICPKHQLDALNECGQAILCYLWRVADSQTHEPLFHAVSSIDHRAGEVVKTVAESLREEGHEQGLEQGRQAAAEDLLGLLLQRFPEAGPELRERVKQASIKDVVRLSTEILRATSVEELSGLLGSGDPAQAE